MENHTIEEFNKLSVSEKMDLILSDRNNIYLVNEYLQKNGYSIPKEEIEKFLKTGTGNEK